MKINNLQLALYIFILISGILLGMIFQQLIIKNSMIEIGHSFAGSIEEVNIDMNETKLVEGIKENIIPIFNQTIQENKENQKCD